MTKSELLKILESYQDDAQIELSMLNENGEPTWYGIDSEITYSPATPDHCLLLMTSEPIMY